MHSYIELQGLREEKVEKTLTNIGPAVFHGAMSTFLGICLTSLGSGFIWQAFFTLWTTVVLTGFVYSIWVLPVILTVFGPEIQIDAEHVHRYTDEKSKSNEITFVPITLK